MKRKDTKRKDMPNAKAIQDAVKAAGGDLTMQQIDELRRSESLIVPTLKGVSRRGSLTPVGGPRSARSGQPRPPYLDPPPPPKPPTPSPLDNLTNGIPIGGGW